jgi:glycine cleavage system H protein
MPDPSVRERAHVCVWMSAGVLTYRLCDRGFDCDRCPLDAALRGGLAAGARFETLLAPSRDARLFPDDRRYTAGHSWVQRLGGQNGRLLRFGLDAFAAAVVGRCGEVAWRAPGRTVGRGETVCHIDLGLGALPIGAPLPGAVVSENAALKSNPAFLVTEPYSEGWILEMSPADPAEVDGLMTADAAREKARDDLQRFRRRIALQLLADTKVGRTMADGGEAIADLRQVVGGPAYSQFLREFIH